MKSKLVGLSLLALAATPAMANTIDTSDAFYSFFTQAQGWVSGPFGIGIAILMLLMGGISGLSRNNPMPALSGVAAAAIFRWGPGIIIDLASNGLVV